MRNLSGEQLHTDLQLKLIESSAHVDVEFEPIDSSPAHEELFEASVKFEVPDVEGEIVLKFKLTADYEGSRQSNEVLDCIVVVDRDANLLDDLDELSQECFNSININNEVPFRLED